MSSQKEKMLNGQLYIGNDPELKNLSRRGRQLVDQYNSSLHFKEKETLLLLPKIFKSIGRASYIEKDLYVDYGSNTSIGDNFYANTRLVLLDVAEINIANNVLFGPNVSLLTAGHPIDMEIRNEGLEYGLPITIQDNVWLGGNVVVNPGVTIGTNSVVGSGAVVTKSIPSNSIAVGNPAKVLRKIDEHDRVLWREKREAYYSDMRAEKNG
ncbi:sugar O-acetyltransferase [Leuconostoc rapi]|uniref:sugar O-acetyltransferase n=1 Tax=Leuconostoc rapi TaxID=1406906 RepID=UPI00195A1DC3|nr:sugar O-acetyltransferase [Leuconostoc rapi]MBM7435106.1 maltose O-acetyltransferase [Leuconostoc rapi]